MITTQKTILVVDDTDAVLIMVVAILQDAGFHVLHASGGEQANKVALDHLGKIDLLLSDVQMPGMSGPDLGISLQRARPDLHVMLMSGSMETYWC